MAKNSLFLLVKSMSKSEKRYVKLVGSTFSKKEKNYLLLFDILDKQEVFNLKKIKAALTENGVTYSYSMLRGYLYDFLLENLLKYNNDDLEYELTSQYHKAKFLCERGLFQESSKIINKLQTRLEELNKFHYLIVPVVSLKLQIHEAKNLKELIEFRRPVWKDWRNSLRASEEVLESRLKIERFYGVYTIKEGGRLNLEKRIETFLDQEEFETEKLVTYTGKYNDFYLLAASYIELKEIEKVKFYLNKILELIKLYDPQTVSESVKMQVWELKLWMAVNEKDTKAFTKIFNSVDEEGFKHELSYSHYLYRKHNQLAWAIEKEIYPVAKFDVKLFVREVDKASIIVSNDQIAEQYLMNVSLLMQFEEYKKASYLSSHWLAKLDSKKNPYFLGAKFQRCLIEFALKKYHSSKFMLVSIESFANRQDNNILKVLSLNFRGLIKEVIKKGENKESIEQAFDDLLNYWKGLKEKEKHLIFVKFDFENWLVKEKAKKWEWL